MENSNSVLNIFHMKRMEFWSIRDQNRWKFVQDIRYPEFRIQHRPGSNALHEQKLFEL